jgi:hypothetical protein
MLATMAQLVCGSARGRTQITTSAGITVSTRSARRAIDGGLLEGTELVGRRAARKADLVPAVGAAVRLIVAGSGTGSGTDVSEQQPRREDTTVHLFQLPSRRAASVVRGTLEARAAAIRVPARAILGSLRKAMAVTGSTSPRPRSRHAP